MKEEPQGLRLGLGFRRENSDHKDENGIARKGVLWLMEVKS